MRRWILTMMFILFVSVLYSLEPPTCIHSVQLGKYATQEEANAAKQQWEAKGLSPVWILNREGTYRVKFGKFPTQTEAYLFSKELRKRGLSANCYATWIDNTEQLNTFPAPSIKITPVIQLQDHIASEDALDGDQEVQAVKNLLTGSTIDTTGTIIRLQSMIVHRQDNDPAKGWAVMTLGRLLTTQMERDEVKRLLLSTKSGIGSRDATERAEVMFQAAKIMLTSDEEGKNRFKQMKDQWKDIVEGRIASTGVERLEAMFNIAKVTHFCDNERLKALKIYREIEELVKNESEDLGECLVWQVQLMLELVQCDIGKIKDARFFALAALERIPTEHKRFRALIELMNLESFLWSNNKDDYPTGLELCKQWESKYSEYLREWGTCIEKEGDFLWRMGDWEASYKEHMRLRNFSDTVEWYPSDHCKQIGEHAYVSYLRAQGKIEESERHFAKTIEKYPKTLTTKRVLKARERGTCITTNKIYE